MWFYTDVEDRLTDLARKAIHEAVGDYREKIIKEAYSIAVQNNTESEISLNNVHDAVKNLQKRVEKKAVLEEELNEKIKDSLKSLNTIKFKRKERRIQYINLSMGLIGLVYIFIGLFYDYNGLDYILYNKSSFITLSGFITILAAFLMSFIFGYSRGNNEERRIESQRYNDLILQLWFQIDYYGKELWSDYLVNNASNMSKDEKGNINSSIDIINRLLDSEGQEQFSKLLEARNKIVHGGYETVRSHEKEEVINIANNIIDKLKGMVKHENPNAALD